MHSHERDLRKLLAGDESSAELLPVTAHVENCSICQDRLAALTGDANWSTIAIDHLRDSSPDDFSFDSCQSAISIELSSGLAEGIAVETESVELDFLSPAVHPELLGRLGRYDIERVIGTGGMGVVLKAHDSELNRIVAIKVLAPHLANNSSARRRFAREVQAAAAVLHPNVLPIYNVESDGKLPYLVMQYVHGLSLQARVDRDGPLDVAVALRIAKQTAAGLAAAHEQGLVHRDVKPANILLGDEVERAQLSDFGLARTVDDASLTRTGIVAGTPHYMSPEQASGEAIDARSDLFSLGRVIYFMLTGHPPFRAESAMAVLNRICHHAHRPVHQVNTSVPRELSQLVDRLLAKTPEKRFQTAAEVVSSLENLLSALQQGRLRIVVNHTDKDRARNRRPFVADAASIRADAGSIGHDSNFSLSPKRAVWRRVIGTSLVSIAIIVASAFNWTRLFAPITGDSNRAAQIDSSDESAQLSQQQPISQQQRIQPKTTAHEMLLHPGILPDQNDTWTRLAQEVSAELDAYEQSDRKGLESQAALEQFQFQWQETVDELKSELDQIESELRESPWLDY